MITDIGYDRVGTPDQNLDLQESALRAAGCDLIRQRSVAPALLVVKNLFLSIGVQKLHAVNALRA